MHRLIRPNPFALAPLFVLALASCNATPDGAAGENQSRWSAAGSPTDPYALPDDLDLGDDWDQGRLHTGQAPRTATTASSPDRRRTTAHTAPPSRGSTRSTAQESVPSTEPTWSIVLSTFSGEGHPESASAFRRNLHVAAPDLAAGAITRTTERGSMVLHGSYTGPDDPRARTDLERIKSMTFNNAPAFPRAFLTLIRPQAQPQADQPHALLAVRRQHPNVQTLYTLQVASWSDFGTGDLAPDEIRRRAEAYARELRAKGHDAYFHHDDRSRISIVTVGVLSASAIDLQSGVESAELRQLRRQFPAHLVNGEPLQELIDRNNPRLGTRVQQPRLVLVPRQ